MRLAETNFEANVLHNSVCNPAVTHNCKQLENYSLNTVSQILSLEHCREELAVVSEETTCVSAFLKLAD